MKITDVKTFVVGNPPPHFGGLYWVFVKLTTDHGVDGYGEVYSVPFHPDVVAQMIADVGERYPGQGSGQAPRSPTRSEGQTETG